MVNPSGIDPAKRRTRADGQGSPVAAQRAQRTDTHHEVGSTETPKRDMPGNLRRMATGLMSDDGEGAAAGRRVRFEGASPESYQSEAGTMAASINSGLHPDSVPEDGAGGEPHTEAGLQSSAASGVSGGAPTPPIEHVDVDELSSTPSISPAAANVLKGLSDTMSRLDGDNVDPELAKLQKKLDRMEDGMESYYDREDTKRWDEIVNQIVEDAINTHKGRLEELQKELVSITKALASGNDNHIKDITADLELNGINIDDIPFIKGKSVMIALELAQKNLAKRMENQASSQGAGQLGRPSSGGRGGTSAGVSSVR